MVNSDEFGETFKPVDELPPLPIPSADEVKNRVAFQLTGYEILAELGRGGMGVVYKARQISLDRPVALKMIIGNPAAEELARFKIEADAFAQLRHPNIVQIYEIGERDGQPFLALEFIEGGTLADRLAGNPVDPIMCAQVVETLARAVHFAHERKIIHRDLKPANILLSGSTQDSLTTHHSPLTATLKIADFGLAKRLDRDAGQTRTGSIMGTPSYMAPEQASGDGADAIGPATDVYALGAILYEMLTGRPPFLGVTPLDTVRQVLHDEPVPPRRLQPGVPFDLETICLKCLAKEPGKRYAGADALADDLARFLGGQPILARPTSRLERAQKWIKRRPALAGLLFASAIAALLLVGLGVGAYYSALLQASLDETEKQRQLKHRYHYLADMNLAQRDWRDRQTPRMLTLLKAYESARPGERDLRSFEWAYLSGLCHTQTMTFAEHAHPVTCVAISPTENLAASGSGTSTFTGGDTEGFGEVRVWDPATGKLRHVLRGHKREVNAVAFSSDGKLLASGGRDNKVRIWNVASGAEIHVLNATGEVRSVAFHPTEPKLAAGTSGKDGRILVWNTRTGLEERTNFKHDNAALSVAFSPDGRWLVAGCGEPRNPRSGEIYIWETPTGKFSQLLLEQDGPVAALAFHPDGKTFASAGEGFIRIWTIGDADPIKRWKAHRERVNALAFDKTGDRLASGCTDSSAAIWNWLKVEDPEIRRGHTGGVRGVAFTSDGAQLLSAANDGTVKVWPARGDQEFHALMGHRDHVSEVAFSPDASRLVSAGHDQTVRIWESARPDEHRQLMGHTGAVQCVAFVFDVKKDAQAWHIVSGGDDATIRFWDAAGLKEVDRLDTPREQVRALAVSRDGTHLAYAGVWDGDENLPADITVLDTRTKKRIATLRGHNSHIASLAFRSDGLRLVSVSSGEVKIWDIASGGEIASIKRTNASKPRAVYSPDGKRLAVANGDVDKGRIAILDANSGKEEGILLNHSGLATALAFTPDGERLVTTDGQLGAPNIKLWDVQTGQEALSLRGPTGLVRSLVFSADGRRLACSGGPLGQPLGEIIVWESRRR